MAVFRVLALDGGGSWAIIQAMALVKLYDENTTGHEVLADFDLAAANSGGSIVLACMIENFTLGQIVNFFNDESQRKEIFSPTSNFGDKVLEGLLGIGPKYSAAKKLTALQNVLKTRGNLLLPQAVTDIVSSGSGQPVHVLITSFDYDSDRGSFFRSKAVSGPSWGEGDEATVTLAEAVHASTNAPVNYFDGPATFPNRSDRYWDGAISGCNNPVLAAVTEAIGLEQAPDSIVALSIGTGNTALPPTPAGAKPTEFTQPQSEPGLKGDILKLAESILDDPPDAASFLAHVMTGVGAGLAAGDPQSRIVRMNPLISPVKSPAGPAGQWGPPGTMTADEFKKLLQLGLDAIEQADVDAISSFADLWLQDQVRNQPIRMNGSTLECELGQVNFSDAADAWGRLRG